MKRPSIALSVIVMLMACVTAFAQQITPKQWADIQQSSDYLIGMGLSADIEEARQMAMSDLASKISTNVERRFDYMYSQETKGKKQDSESKVNNIIRSYTSVRLENVSEYLAKEKGKTVVYRYMKTSELSKMFKRRLNMAKKWAQEASEREKEGKVGDALQDYYWALALLRSCPDADLETLDGGGGQNMMQEVFHRVKDILDKVSVKALTVDREDNNQRITLDIEYGNKPAANFNYKYTDGKSVSEVYRAKDGMGELVLPAGVKLNKLKVYAEYECREEANIHPELRSVMEQTEPVPFQTALFNVNTKECVVNNDYVMQIAGSAPAKNESAATATTQPVAAPSTLNPQEAALYLPTMQRIEQALVKGSWQTVKDCFTDEGWVMFSKLMNYGTSKMLKSPEVSFYRDNGEVVCRSFPMSFSFKGNRRTFTEDVVFYMTAEGKVNEVAFGLGQTAVDDVMGRGEWSAEARTLLIHFLETYKTAYALKRLDYINSIFSQNALIITGSVVKSTGQSELKPAKMQHVKYTRQTKEQYMAGLKRCFASNEYINIRFADNIVRRSSTKPNIYGIQIKQDYYSSSYGDTGYLFLLIDFADTKAPMIHVRTWQPDNDPNVRDGRIGMADFIW